MQWYLIIDGICVQHRNNNKEDKEGKLMRGMFFSIIIKSQAARDIQNNNQITGGAGHPK